MTARALIMSAASYQLMKFRSYRVGRGPSCIPPNYGYGRFVWEISGFQSYGYPGFGNGPTTGLSVWDWSPSANRYEMSGIATTTNWDTLYGTGAPGLLTASGALCMVNATQVLAVNAGAYESTSTTRVARSLTTLAAAPSGAITFTTPATSTAYDEPTVASTEYSYGIAYNGNMLVGYASDGAYGGYGTSNGWVQKIGVSTASRNATALRTGLPADLTQDRVAHYIAGLGGASPNGYLVAGVTGASYGAEGATARAQLVNATGTPVAVGAQLAYAATGPRGLFALGATKVVMHDAPLVGAVNKGRLSLLNTNSASAPTTLTKGAEVYFPDPIDFPLSEYKSSITYSVALASNAFFEEGKSLIWVTWENVGFNSFWSRLARVTSTSASNLTMTLVTEVDLNGKPAPVIFGSGSAFKIPRGDHPIIPAPGGKAAVFVPLDDGTYEQYVYQL